MWLAYRTTFKHVNYLKHLAMPAIFNTFKQVQEFASVQEFHHGTVLHCTLGRNAWILIFRALEFQICTVTTVFNLIS